MITEDIDIDMLLATAESIEQAGEIYFPKQLRAVVNRVQELEAAHEKTIIDLGTCQVTLSDALIGSRIAAEWPAIAEAARALSAKVQELEREQAITEGAHELTARTLTKARDQIKELERRLTAVERFDTELESGRKRRQELERENRAMRDNGGSVLPVPTPDPVEEALFTRISELEREVARLKRVIDFIEPALGPASDDILQAAFDQAAQVERG